MYMYSVYIIFNHATDKFSIQYDKVGRLMREFEPYKNLWITASDWTRWQESWMNEALVNIDAELMATNVQAAFKTLHKSVKYFK